MGKDVTPLDDFLSTLASSRTVERCRAALDDFTPWYVQTSGREPDWRLLTAVEIKDYLANLQGVRRFSAASVNLRLAAVTVSIFHIGVRREK